MQLDIGMLLESDNMDGTMIPALHSNPDFATLPSNSTAISDGRDISTTTRSHLYPMTNADEARDRGAWDPQVYPYGARPWPAEGETYSYYPYSNKPPASHPHIPQESSLDANNRTSYAATHPSSFPTDPGSYDILTGMHVNPGLLSPNQSHEEAQWQMYLTASLSNPLDSLGLNGPQTPASLSYPSDLHGAVDIPEEQICSPRPLPLPSTSTFAPSIGQPTALFDQLPFTDNLSQLSNLPSSNTIASNYIQDVMIDGYMTQGQEDTPRRNETMSIPNGNFASLMQLTPPNFEFGSARFSSLEAPVHLLADAAPLSSPRPSSARGRSPILARPSPIRPRRGLSGWGARQYLNVPSGSTSAAGLHKKRLRSASSSPTAGSRRPQAVTPVSSSANSEQASSTRAAKRPRLTEDPKSLLNEFEVALPNNALESELESDEDAPADDADSDDYRPSRSPSVGPSFSSRLIEFHREDGVESSTSTKKKTKRGKGKAKGSAALALAVVTQLGAGNSREGSEQFDDDFDPVAVYREGRTEVRKRKNHPIPLPVPVPNLNKKSRGRKVPFVAGLATTSSAGSTSSTEGPKGGAGIEEGGEGQTSNSGRARRKTTRTPTPVTDELAGSRTYVCVVPGCGKCFVRGEHLKRHVRSIHTHDKPHPCPFDGCDKSFSRRDNLGQHVRIHLQP
ncbi:hypothetical protein BDZ97DRAFT_1167637 [Flammula alnicola]|nr:hypothetical protein BDZ97DRAFT_1167637 [Flammula alnicola]